ncbi:glycoside hydrolase family 31 protein [Mucilaginibacter myungsuensis]|uniref:Glycoside hydrolase family 31 protein n=1 Tax=Mucilaginibacter myungsuensis TaxID=649104 RepID=A0A929PUZ5_9SPHI|nr:glycoside hydrolase family 31 protein [Mucilaginibacter myungsuensis]MBE9660456.1 glycoside hydrolase family 31 protein [Mucilaginibacter myungsuensis]MDN3600498.1 glycoside hydrolase family 31 protein [Mucilaginibacter myungsuensis]
MEENVLNEAIEIPIDDDPNSFRHLNNPADGIKPIVKKYLNPPKAVEQTGNKFYFTDGEAKVEAIVVTNEIIRIRLAPHGVFLEDFSYAIPKDVKPIKSEFTLIETADEYRISTTSINCHISKKNFYIAFSDKNEYVTSVDSTSMHWEENAQFGGYYVYGSKVCHPDETFFGLGDKPTELNLRGKRFTNWNTDAYSYSWGQDPLYRTIPFYVSVNEGIAHGIFFDNTFKSHFDFGLQQSDSTSFWADGGEMQYYYIHGPHIMDVVKRYHVITGTHPMPPMWALGYHQCRWSYYPETKLRAVTKGFRANKIPCDGIYLDIDYMDGYRCFTWNRKYFPDPKKMIADLAADGFKTVVIIDPGIRVDDSYEIFREGKEKKYFCRRCDDYFMEGHVWPGRCQFPDFTNPEVRTWWGGLFDELVEMGVAGVWNDMNEPAVFGAGTFPDDVRHQYDGHRGSHRKAHNVYGMQMVRATYEGLRKLMKNKRPFTITRAGYSGLQRYASVWTGDNVASWEHLAIGNIQCQRLSMSGVPFCGTDIGGFSGEPDGELFTRWIQLGTFSPFMRAHSAGDTKEREPWSFGEPFTSINRKFIELRYRLLPYLYSTFWEHHRYGFPILRPVVMQEQHVLKNHYRQDEFTYGDKLLICPVLHPGQTSRKVYLPKGKWYNFWDNTVVEGGDEVEVATPLDTIPLFVKAGSVIPEYPVQQYVGEKEIEEVKLNIYYSDYEANSFMFEDYGETFAYEQDIYLEKKFAVNGTEADFVIQQSLEGLYNPRYENYAFSIVGLPFRPLNIMIDNKWVTNFTFINNKLEFRHNKKFHTVKIMK